MTTLDELLVKLRAMYSHRGDGIPTQYVNPDGPAAADALEAAARENERLKRALKRIGKIRDPAGDAGKWGFTGLATAQSIARNALSGGPHE